MLQTRFIHLIILLWTSSLTLNIFTMKLDVYLMTREPSQKESYMTQPDQPPLVQYPLDYRVHVTWCVLRYSLRLVVPWCLSLSTLPFLHSVGGIHCLGEELIQKKREGKRENAFKFQESRHFKTTSLNKMNYTYLKCTIL